MDLKNREFEVPENEPYKNDLLNRQEFGENLTKIVSQITSPLTMSVNGAWGTGKTVFLKMWNQSLKNAEFTTIYFSAWEDDYCNDALLALMGQIWGSIKDGDWKEMGKTLNEIAIPLAKNIGSQIIAGVTRIATVGAVGLDVETLKAHPEKMLEKYVDTTLDLKSTKKRLTEFSEKCRNKTGKPLVIIIDELDRCRPLFAIELLEKIKHLFELPGVVFVLGVDREQLGHSIRSVYGERMDVDGYLRRFIDLEFFLKTNDATSFFKSILEKYRFADTLQLIDPEWAMLVSKCFRLSLREMEYLTRAVVVGAVIDSKMVSRLALPLLVALKLRDEDFYKEIISCRYNATEIIDRLMKTYNAWELFGINPDTKQLGRGYGQALCTDLYAISPQSWREEVGLALMEIEEKRSKPSDHLFHPVVQKVYNMAQPTRNYFDSNFDMTLHQGIPVNEFSKCIELVAFKDETPRR
jgi:hypothetical protein